MSGETLTREQIVANLRKLGADHACWCDHLAALHLSYCAKCSLAAAVDLLAPPVPSGAQRIELRDALREARAGLEAAVDGGCRCSGGFRCTAHLALDIANAALVDPQEGRDE